MRISKSLVLSLYFSARCLGLPLSFEERGPQHFLARSGNGTVELRPDRIVLRDVTLRFAGAGSAAHLEGLGTSSPSTYLRAGLAGTIRQFPRLRVHNLYPGVDAVFYGNEEGLEYDLNLASGVSPGRVRIALDGARDMRMDSSGNLIFETASGELRQMRPRVFQGKREISARYILLGKNEVGIRLGKYDRRLPLTIDPVLAFTKYFGGSGSSMATTVATDAQGNIYLAGQTNSADFPITTNSFETRFTPPLEVLSNAGKTVNGLRVGTALSAGVMGGTPDGTILYAATATGILLSGDSGTTWRKTAPLPVPATVNSISLDSLDPATILVATTAGLFGSNSGGEFWGLHVTGLPVSASGSVSVSSAFFNPVNPLIAYSTTSSPAYLFVSADAGNSWTQLDPTYPGEPPAPTIPYPPAAATITPDGGILYAVNGNGTLLKSADGGASWTKLAQGLYGPLGYGNTQLQLDPTNSSTLYLLSPVGLQKSTDGGQTFTMVTAPASIHQFGVDSTGALYVTGLTPNSGGINLIYVGSDGGKTFTAIPHLLSPGVNALTTLAGNVYAGSITAQVPFVVKLDPSGSNILYSTFIGGSLGDQISGIAVDSQGNAVLVGSTSSPDFPLTVPAANAPAPGKADGFVAKLSADGMHLVYATALGGSKPSGIQAVALDSSGAVFVTGRVFGADYPTTANAFQPAIPPSPCTRPQANLPILPVNMGSYAFVTKLSADGSSMVYSTFLTGSCGSGSQGIAVDAAGDAIVVGYTTSPDFPVSANGYQAAFPGDATQVSPPATFDAGFVAELSPAGDKLLAGSYLGGGYASQANSVALDAAGDAYITGSTQGFVTGTTPGVFQPALVDRCAPPFYIGPSLPNTGTGDGFVIHLDPALSSAKFLTYVGGSCSDSGSKVALDADGNIWVGGTTQSPDFPVKDPFQGSGNGFVSELNPDASQLLFSSLSDGAALALGPVAVILAGASGNSAFAARIDPATTPTISISSVSAVMGFPPSTVISPGFPSIAPGQFVQISGRNLGPAAKVTAQMDAAGRLPFILSNTIVFFDNVPAPLISVQASSIMCFVPFEITATTEVTVSVNGQRSPALRTSVVASAPQILTIANQDGTANSADHPAKAGSVIALYVSGFGQTIPPGVDGLVNSAPLPVPAVPVTVYAPITAAPITPQSVSGAPGMIAGITQVNIQLPATINATGGTVQIALSGSSVNATLYVTP